MHTNLEIRKKTKQTKTYFYNSQAAKQEKFYLQFAF